MADQSCDICGSSGYAELIVTCSKCKVVREHCYCMRIKTRVVPKFWLCEQCELNGAKFSDYTGLHAQHRLKKIAETGKVKFLSTAEVVELSSGGMKGPSSKPNMVSAPQKTSVSRKIPANSIPRPLFHATTESKDQKSAKDCSVKKRPFASRLPPAMMAQAPKRVKVLDKEPCASFVPRHSVPVTYVGKKVPVVSLYLEDRQKQTKDVLVSSKECKGINEVDVETTVKKSASSSSRHCLPIGRPESLSIEATKVGVKKVENKLTFIPSSTSPSPCIETTKVGVKKGENNILVVPAFTSPSIEATKIGVEKVENKVPPFIPSSMSPQAQYLEKAENKASFVFPLSAETLQKNVSGCRNHAFAVGQNAQDEERVLQNVIAKFNIYQQYLPASHASWKGVFHIVDGLRAGEFYGGFLAKPPCKVHRRAYEFSRMLPSVLQVELLARSFLWDDQFHKNCPDLGDIALYFFPSDNIERSKMNNSRLFEFMERENLFIRSFLDGAQLLIFTSKQLDINSQYIINRLNGECSLLGVFCKSNQALPDIPSVECAPAVAAFNGRRNSDDNNDIKKEIVVKKESNIENSAAAAALRDLDSKIEKLLLEFGPGREKKSDDDTPTKNIQSQHQVGDGRFFLSKVKTEPISKAGVEEDRRCLEAERFPRLVSTFSLRGSQTEAASLNEVKPSRVADKHLQNFSPVIKKKSQPPQ